MFGGYDGEAFHANLWALDTTGGRRSTVPLSGEPTGRGNHRAIVEPLRGLLVAFGGGVTKAAIAPASGGAPHRGLHAG